MTVDAFDTARLRAAVLGAWRSSPARLREDANTEEDHARGYYRDRVVVELAQNAADAATRAGVPGRLLLRLDHADDGTAVLVAANTGAPLDAAGVASLASMRASAKRPDAGQGVVHGTGHAYGAGRTEVVGRFGVGFAAVRAVADEVDVLSTSGGVRFSLADTRSALAAAAQSLPELEQEVRRRDGSLPALRLPWPAQGRPPLGYDTAVVLQLRDEVALDEVRALLDEVDDALLVALPGLVEILVEVPDAAPRRIADVVERWVLSSAEGEVPLALVADRPVEERSARAWRVTWAVPRAASSGGPDRPVTWRHVVHAPTPTDDAITVPALLVATLPLDPTRRHVALGPLADAVLEHAADVYAELAELLARDGHEPLALVPVGLPAGALDSSLHQHLVARLARTPLLPTAAGGGELVAPDVAVAVDGPPGAEAALGRLVPALVTVPAGRAAQARTLGVELLPLSDLVDGLPALRDADWLSVYTDLDAAATDARAREALAGLPVPLADGRVVRGARGAVMLPDGLPGQLAATTLEALARWGLRVVDPAVAHRLLERLGATAPDAAGLLAHDAVRLAVLAQADDDDLEVADEVTDAVLDLVRAVLADGGRPPAAAWLGLLTLPAADGEPTPAHGLVLPGSAAAALLDDRVLAPVALEAVDRWGADVLTAVGVRQDLVVVQVDGVLADPAALDPDATDSATLAAQSLDAWPDYLAHLAEHLGPGAYVGDLSAVADLDAVADEAWPQVLDRVAGDPRLRRALLEPVRDEHGRHAEPYTAWWLRTRSGLVPGGPFALSSGADDGATPMEPAGHAPSPGAGVVEVETAVRSLLPPVPEPLAGVDPAVLRTLGGVARLAELDADGWVRVLDDLPGGRGVDPTVAVAVWRALAALAVADGPPVAPERVPALVGTDRVAAVHVEDAAVADSPQWLQRVDVAAMVPVPPSLALAVAGLLDLPLASDLTPGEVDDDDALEQPVPASARALVDGPSTWSEHEDLRVDGAAVDWWVDGAGGLHATTFAGLAAALAQVSGRWSMRWALETVLTDPGRAAEVRLGEAADPF